MKKIDAMKRAAERKRREEQMNIQEVRTTIAGELLKGKNKGDLRKCNPDQND